MQAVKRERCESGYEYIVSQTELFNLTLEKIEIKRTHREDGTLVTSFKFCMRDKKSIIHTARFKMYDEQYIWLLKKLEERFPGAEFLDNTAEEDAPKGADDGKEDK